jgi:hypothetical protein
LEGVLDFIEVEEELEREMLKACGRIWREQETDSSSKSTAVVTNSISLRYAAFAFSQPSWGNG